MLDAGHQVKLGVQRCKNGVKDAASDPSAEPLIYCTPLAELRWKVAPGCSGAGNPQDALNSGAVVLGVGAAIVSALAGEKWGNAFPLAVW